MTKYILFENPSELLRYLKKNPLITVENSEDIDHPYANILIVNGMKAIISTPFADIGGSFEQFPFVSYPLAGALSKASSQEEAEALAQEFEQWFQNLPTQEMIFLLLAPQDTHILLDTFEGFRFAKYNKHLTNPDIYANAISVDMENKTAKYIQFENILEDGSTDIALPYIMGTLSLNDPRLLKDFDLFDDDLFDDVFFDDDEELDEEDLEILLNLAIEELVELSLNEDLIEAVMKQGNQLSLTVPVTITADTSATLENIIEAEKNPELLKELMYEAFDSNPNLKYQIIHDTIGLTIFSPAEDQVVLQGAPVDEEHFIMGAKTIFLKSTFKNLFQMED